MANDDCLPQVQACRIRVANLDPNGVPTPGSNNLYVSDALSEMNFEPVYEDATEILERTACDNIYVNYQGPPTLKRGEGEISILTQDPYLQAMLGGGDVLTDNGVHGFAYPQIGMQWSEAISIELWAKRIDDGDLHAEYPYAHWVFPSVSRLRHGQRTLNNGAQIPTYTFELYENENWFDGPLNDWPVASDRFAQWFPTATLPTAVCGPQSTPAS